MIKLNMKNRNISKISKKDMKLPSWADWEKNTPIKHTIKSSVKKLIEELPSGFKFPVNIIQDKMTMSKEFKGLDVRRTSEALLTLEKEGVLYSDKNWHESDSEYHAFNGRNKVKLYKKV